jgi:SAM-dependent methyltransferase
LPDNLFRTNQIHVNRGATVVDKRSTERFTSRVENYVRYRPDYPAGVIPLLQREIGLTPDWAVADIGSGPGNLTRRFLEIGSTVYGVEPNEAMREAGEALLGADNHFISVAGTAEATTLPDTSIDLVAAGQAFHWFDPVAARTEFRRILRTPGWVALIWNRRTTEQSPMLDDYHKMLLAYSNEFEHVSVRDDSAESSMNTLFGDSGYRAFTLPHEQNLNADAFWGRLLSSSYTPLPGQPGHDEIRARSGEIFDTYSEDGVLRFPYVTQVFLGQVIPDGASIVTK